MAKTTPALPTGPLRDLLLWWRQTRVKGVIIGGLAVAFHGRPRLTRDVDAIVFVEEERWAKFVDKGKQFSFRSRSADVLKLAKETRVLLVHHEPSGIDVDLIVAGILFEEQVLERAKKVKVARLSVPVATAEDMIILKAIANRPIDLRDLDGLFDSSTQLDYAYIRKNAEHFAAILDTPKILEDLDPRLLEHEKLHRSKKK